MLIFCKTAYIPHESTMTELRAPGQLLAELSGDGFFFFFNNMIILGLLQL